MPANALAIPVPEQKPQILKQESKESKNLLRATRELKALNLKRVSLQKRIYNLNKNTSNNHTDIATQDYVSNLQDLQAVFDKVFISLDYSNYSADLGEPVIFTNPDQVIADMRAEWMTEYVAMDILNNMQRSKQRQQEFQRQRLYEKTQKEASSQRKKKTLTVKLVRLDLDIERKQKYILKSQQAIKTQKIVEVKQHKKSAIKKLYTPSKKVAFLVFPIKGKIIMGFGEKNTLGVKSRGLVLQADISKDVVAPKDGVVRFAGPFGKFKQLLIVEHQDGYHSLITGFDTINTRVGEKLVAGDIIGHLAATQAYYELRHNGVPIDPKKVINSL